MVQILSQPLSLRGDCSQALSPRYKRGREPCVPLYSVDEEQAGNVIVTITTVIGGWLVKAHAPCEQGCCKYYVQIAIVFAVCYFKSKSIF